MSSVPIHVIIYFQNQEKQKKYSLLGWPSGSLMTAVLCSLFLRVTSPNGFHQKDIDLEKHGKKWKSIRFSVVSRKTRFVSLLEFKSSRCRAQQS